MTKEEWGKVEQALSGTYGYVVLSVEGREITLVRGQVGKNRLGVMTYVDGEFSGKWINPKNNCPESRFFRLTSRFIYSKKNRDKLKRMGKKFLESRNIDPEIKLILYDPVWFSIRSIRKHYEQNFKGIKLIKIWPA